MGWENLLILYLQEHNLGLAHEAILTLQVINASSPFVWFGHGMVKKMTGKYPSDFIDDFRCSFDLGLQTDCLLAYADAAARSGKDVDQAYFAITKFLELCPLDAEGWNTKGVVSASRG